MKIKKYLKQLIVVAALFTLTLVPTYAAVIGDQLLEPETGWKRIDADYSDSFEFSNDITRIPTYPNAYKGTLMYTKSPGDQIKFKFKGTQLRLFTLLDLNSAVRMQVTLDGVPEEITLSYPDRSIAQGLCYEKLNLEDKVHEVILTGFEVHDISVSLDAIDINTDGYMVDVNYVEPINPVILDVVPEKDVIQTNELVNVDLTIDNITEIAAEDILIKYNNAKLDFINFEEIDGMKLVHSIVDEDNGTLRVIIASKGEAHIVNTEEILLTLKFKGIAEGDALVDITKGKVANGIEMEKDLLEENCDQAIITIVAPSDVNNSGEYTLLDLSIDARHYAKDPSIAELSKYNTDVIVNNAIDDADLLEIAREMMLNSNYKL